MFCWLDISEDGLWIEIEDGDGIDQLLFIREDNGQCALWPNCRITELEVL